MLNVNSYANFLKVSVSDDTWKREVLKTHAEWFSSANIQSFSVNVHLRGDAADQWGRMAQI